MSKNDTHFLILDMKTNANKEVGRVIRKYKDEKAANRFFKTATKNEDKRNP
jgi:hypothetical protein